MFSSVIKKTLGFWNGGNERTSKINKNVSYTFLIKGMSILITFLLVPLTIHYVNDVQYGIWITIVTLVGWMNTFDIGLSNGLRNKLAHLLAVNEHHDLLKYTSTTYALLFIIAGAAFSLFFVLGSFFNWNHLLNIKSSVPYDIWPVMVIALGAFCIQFALQPINSILIASHQPFKASLILLVGQVITLILTYLLTKYTNGNLLLLVMVASGSPLLVLLAANLYLFRTGLKNFAPSYKQIDFRVAKDLLNVGGAFFFIQLGALILYETDNIVITKTLGSAYVTTFFIGYKYFSIITVVFSIIITPYWSAFTDAYAKADFAWIKQALRKMRVLWLLVSVATLLFYFSSPLLYKLWMGAKMATLPAPALSFSIAICTIVQAWTVIHAYLLNGVGKLKVQLILVVSTGIINIPLSVWLVHLIGLSGTVWANIIVMMVMNLFLTYQSKLIINNNAFGIWNK